MGRTLACVTVMIMVMTAACSSDEDGTGVTESSSATTAPVSPVTSMTTDSSETTTTDQSTIVSSTSTTLPGNPIDIGPLPGDVLMVVGVAHDDFLNLRSAPGSDQPIIDQIDPVYTGLIAQGNTRQIPGALWIEVDHEGKIGWVHLSYVAYQGAVTDLTSEVVDQLGEYPTAETMAELGLLVARTQASDEPRSEMVLVIAETSDDLGEVTYDVIGLGDDAVRGLRLHVFGEPGNGAFTLKAVEATSLCARGVSSEGLCV